MTIHERAAVALARARAAGAPASLVDTAHQRRLRAAMIRDVATLLAVPPEQVLVTDDPVRAYGSMPGQLITVQDPDDPTVLLRFIPEPGNTGTGAAPISCSPPARRAVGSTGSVRYRPCRSRVLPTSARELPQPTAAAGTSPIRYAVEFFDDPQHEPDCPLR